jgi:hypothetical protein
MKKNKCSSLSFRDLSLDECASLNGGTGFAYDVGRSIRFLIISAQGAHGPAMAVADWVGNTFLES